MALDALSLPVLGFVTLIFGMLVGSFLNVVIHRLPIMMERDWTLQCKDLLDARDTSEAREPGTKSLERFDLVVPRSRCPSCGHQITAMENIPVLSYVMLRGKCSNCQTPIGIRYPLIEMLTGALAAWVIIHFGANFIGASALALTFALIALTFIDADTQLLPDSITLPFLWLGLAFNWHGGLVPLEDAVLGAMAGYLSLWSVYQAFKLLTGKEGMGYGDFKLLAMLGAWLGYAHLPVIIMFSSLVGAVVGGALMVFARHGRDVPIPFGPYIAAAGFLAMLFGTDINTAYLDTMFPGSRYS